MKSLVKPNPLKSIKIQPTLGRFTLTFYFFKSFYNGVLRACVMD